MAEKKAENEQAKQDALNAEEPENTAETGAEPTDEAEALRAAIEAGDFDINDFLRQYKEALSAREEAEARALRVQADFDNFRRRSRKDAEEAGRRANAELVTQLLPVVDNFERALAMMESSADRDGVEMILKQLLQTLENCGVRQMEAEGEIFDPNFHQAVLQESVDDERKGRVLTVLQKGYLMDDKLLRAAMVQVGV